MKKYIFAPLFLLGALVLSGCGKAQNQTNTMPSSTQSYSSTQSTQQSQSDATQANAVNIQNFAFSPETLTIKKGTTVTWTNNDSAMHQIKGSNFSSGALKKGEVYSFTFNDTGAFDYICAIHPMMKGKIVVQ